MLFIFIYLEMLIPFDQKQNKIMNSKQQSVNKTGIDQQPKQNNIFIIQMQNLFKEALEYIKNLPSEPTKGSPQISNDDKLAFYALFKQATVGPNNTKAPSRLKIVQKYKWNSWAELGKISKEEAMRMYVQRLTKIAPNWNARPKL